MERAARPADADPLLTATGWRRFAPGSESDGTEVVHWWLQHTSNACAGAALAASFLSPTASSSSASTGLHRFIEKKPLAQVHQCALAVLALESELVDPRL